MSRLAISKLSFEAKGSVCQPKIVVDTKIF